MWLISGNVCARIKNAGSYKLLKNGVALKSEQIVNADEVCGKCVVQEKEAFITAGTGNGEHLPPKGVI